MFRTVPCPLSGVFHCSHSNGICNLSWWWTWNCPKLVEFYSKNKLGKLVHTVGFIVRICCECCMLSGRGLCVWLITRSEESLRLWSNWVWSWSEEFQAKQVLSSYKQHFSRRVPVLLTILYQICELSTVSHTITQTCVISVTIGQLLPGRTN